MPKIIRTDKWILSPDKYQLLVLEDTVTIYRDIVRRLISIIRRAKKLGNWTITVNPRGSSQECHKCHFVSPTNRDQEKFVCENCGHHEDADTQAGSVLAQRGIKKLGIGTLTVVSRKVTTEPELTGSSGNRKNASSALVDESGNPAKYVQLELFSDWEWKTG